jgi:hypothetical protein
MNSNPTHSQRLHVLLTPSTDVTIDVIVNGQDELLPVVLLPSSMRGIDDSRGPFENFTLHTLADDVATTIRELGNDHLAVVVGHSVTHVTDLDYPTVWHPESRNELKDTLVNLVTVQVIEGELAMHYFLNNLTKLLMQVLSGLSR